MRNLASIQEIASVKPIEGADAIELVIIKGWQCVSKKGEFAGGDKCVYFEVDSYLPLEERYEFLRRTSYRNNEFMGEGLRIKTITMRGEISQGLALPLAAFPEISETAAGADVTEQLGVRKWEVPEVVGSSGIEIGEKPFSIPTTDETRLQSMTEFLEAFAGKPYYISTKMDGTSCSLYTKDGAVGVCGRNKEYKEDTESCAMWAWVYKKGLKEKLASLGENIALQGEFCGHGIQKNRLKLLEPNLYIFDIVRLEENGSRPKLGLKEAQGYCERLGLDMVPIEETGESFSYTLEELLEKARGKYQSGMDKEGIVVRTQEFAHNSELQHKMSFKVLNNDFLKKEKD
ncbi:MAG: 2'-5' RNA ligase [Oscillospiraceae bacterium]|nr:2'-5' RNA ligase [Oscillospiraceae bacterium]